MSEPDKSSNKKKNKRKDQERPSDTFESSSTVAPQHNVIESSTKTSGRSGAPPSSTKRFQRTDSNEPLSPEFLAGNIVQSILSDAETMSSDNDHVITRESLAAEARAALTPVPEKGWQVPKSHIALVYSFDILKFSMKAHPGINNQLWYAVYKSILAYCYHIEWIKALPKDFPSELHPQRVVRAYLTREPDPTWLYLPYIIQSFSEDLSSFAFKSRATLKYLCERFRLFLLEYDETGEDWEIDTTGETLLKRVEEFMEEQGMDIIQPLQNSSVDDRIHSNLPPISSLALEVQPTTSAGSTALSGTAFHHTPSILRNLKEVKLDSLTKTQIDAFKESIRQNRIQHAGYTFSRDLLPQSTQYQLNNLWNLYEQALGKEWNKINDREWKTIPEDKFYSFLDTLSDSNFIVKEEDATVNDIYKRLKAGLTINPFALIDSLKQITPFQQELKEKQITCTIEQLKVIDEFTLENLRAVNCSHNFKLKAKSFKSELGPPTEDTQPFRFFIQLCGHLGKLVRQSDELLDWVDSDAHKGFHQAKNKPTELGSASAKALQDNSDNRSRNARDNKRKSHDKQQNNSAKAGPKESQQKPKDSQSKPLCSHCGYDNHVSFDCQKFRDENIDKDLLNMNPNISFAESDRGKFLISRGYEPKFMREKNPVQRKAEDNSSTQPSHPRKKAHHNPKSKCNLCSISAPENLNIPLINVHISSQNSLGAKDITCLLDSGADVDYVDAALVDNMRANNLIINCVNYFTCSGIQACHPITGLINLTISYTNELGQHYNIVIKAHIVKNLSYSLIIGRETIRKYNFILQFQQNFLNLVSLPRY